MSGPSAWRPGRIGIEAQIEDAAGLAAVEAIAAASPRLVSLVFGPADFMASIGMRSLMVGGQPEGYAFDAHHYPLMRMLVAAKARGLQAIDGPYAKIGDIEGLRAAATSTAALGYDGKWVLHPAQVEVVNDAFTPAPGLRAGGAHPGGLRAGHGGGPARRGHARRRDDRRGVPQAGARDRGEG